MVEVIINMVFGTTAESRKPGYWNWHRNAS